MRPTAKKHHFVSQAYLGAFTDNGTKKGKLCIYDKQNGESYKSKPAGVAAKRDFNRIDVANERIDALETSLAEVESELLPAIAQTVANGEFPSENDLIKIINVIALYFAHNPKPRASLNQSKAQLTKLMAYHIAKKETDVKRRMEMINLIEGDSFNPAFSPESSSRVELSALDDAISALLERRWMLLESGDLCPDFITSDHPVVLVQEETGAASYAGLGSVGFSVHFPISPKYALYGSHAPLEGTKTLEKPDQVIGLNTVIYRTAIRQVYSREEAISYFKE